MASWIGDNAFHGGCSVVNGLNVGFHVLGIPSVAIVT